MFLRLATKIMKMPTFRITRYMAPTLISINHSLILHNLSQLHLEIQQTEELTDELDVLYQQALTLELRRSQQAEYEKYEYIQNLMIVKLAGTIFKIPKFYCFQGNHILQELQQSKDRNNALQYIETLKPSINQMNQNQISTLAKSIQLHKISDEELSIRIFQRCGQLFQENTSFLTMALNIGASIGNIQKKSPKYFQEVFKLLFPVIQAPYLNVKQFTFAILLYGQSVEATNTRLDQVEKNILQQIPKLQGQFDSNDLILITRGIVLSHWWDCQEIFNLIKQNCIEQKMRINDFIFIAMVFFEKKIIDDIFWIKFQEQFISEYEQIPSQSTLLGMVLAKDGDVIIKPTQEFINILEKLFLKYHDQYTEKELICFYIGFAYFNNKSQELWKQFNQDFEKLIQPNTLQLSYSLVYQLFISIYDNLDKNTQEIILKHINQYLPQMKQEFQMEINKKLQQIQ